MSGYKRKKIVLLSSSEEEEEEEKVVQQPAKAKAKPKKREAASAKKRKPLVVSDDDDDDDDGAISINAIKKQAKTKARKLMNADSADEEGGSSGKKAGRTTNKTPPAQKNTLFNYFKPSSEKKANGTGTSSNGSQSTPPFTSVKDKASGEEKEKEKKAPVEIGDDFMTTTLTKGKPAVVKASEQTSSSSSSKPKESKAKEEPKKPSAAAAAAASSSKSATKESSKEKESESKSSKGKAIKEETAHKKPLPKPSPLKDDEKRKPPPPPPQVPAKKQELTPKKKEQQQPAKKELTPKKKEQTPKKEPPKASEPAKAAKAPPSTSTFSFTTTTTTAALPRLPETKRVSDLWVDKYRPSSTKAVIGLQGERSPMNKLRKWLRNWHLNLDQKPVGKWGGGGGGSDDGAGLRAALLSGPPGIGKTTTAQLVCAELGYDYLELNASDVRNKRSLHEDVGELLANTKLTSFFGKAANASSSSSSNASTLTAKHCVIMDEVDGMSGNEDRGGVAELIQLIKRTKVPLICICNDRGDAKMRSLVNYCFDLRFSKPNLAQIKAALKSIAFKERMNVADGVLDELIASSNFDIRQCIHGLSMLAAGHQGESSAKVNEMINGGKQGGGYSRPIKDVKLGPFDAIRKVFATGEEYARMSFEDKSGLFFADYGIMPLFVYENYSTINLSSKEPSTAKQLRRLSAAINAISLGDLVEREVRSNQNWSLLPLQAAFSTVMPGAAMRSANGLGFPAFPAWMGKLSTTNKNHRLVDELVAHMRLAITGTRTAFPLDYLQPLARRLVAPLASGEKAGISSVLDLMAAYSLTKANMDSLLELSLWSGQEDPMKRVEAKTKAALTRAYNSTGAALPYATENDFKKVVKRGAKKEEGAAKGGKGGKKPKKNSLVVMDERENEEEEGAGVEDEEEEEIGPDEMDFY